MTLVELARGGGLQGRLEHSADSQLKYAEQLGSARQVVCTGVLQGPVVAKAAERHV
jgi:hypothetical protein